MKSEKKAQLNQKEKFLRKPTWLNLSKTWFQASAPLWSSTKTGGNGGEEEDQREGKRRRYEVWGWFVLRVSVQ